MALQSSGAISLSNVQTEFGGSAPISISEYYGSDTVPSSGTISLSDFYGTSNAQPDQASFLYNPVDDTYLSYIVLGGVLGASNGDIYYLNTDNDGQGIVTYGGVNSVGENVAPWAGGSGGIENQRNYLMITPTQDPNDWDYFQFTMYTASGNNDWYISGPVWTPFTPTGHDTAYYLTDGTVYSTSGGLADSHPDITSDGNGSLAYVAASKLDADATTLPLIDQAMNFYFSNSYIAP